MGSKQNNILQIDKSEGKNWYDKFTQKDEAL